MPSPSTAPDWETAELQALFGVLNKALNESSFLTGDEISIADFAVAGMTTYFPIAGFPFEFHPRFKDWSARMEATEGWRATRDPLWDSPIRSAVFNHQRPYCPRGRD